MELDIGDGRFPLAVIAPLPHPALQALLDAYGLASLDCSPRAGTLDIASLAKLVRTAGQALNLDPHNEQLTLAAILLWHDHFDAAHEIAQEIEDANGSLLHGIAHRREPDYSNAKYWFRRAGRHACYTGLASAVSEISSRESALITSLLPNRSWDPFKFVDACADVARSPGANDRRTLLQEVQRLEFRAFLAELL